MEAKEKIRFRELRGAEAAACVRELSALRISVFREFPYLYDGDENYERKYLETYFSCPESFVCLALTNESVIGAATAIPMIAEEECFRAPFLARGLDPSAICYYGESMLIPKYRGLGIGQSFMSARERYAKSLPGVRQACFCAVVREANHPSKPHDYRSLEAFWAKNGFRKIPGLTTEYSWKEIGEMETSPKLMQFWIKDL